MSTLIVALPLVRPTVGTEFAYALSADGHGALGHGVAPLALLPDADELVLAVPARVLSWHELKLPPVAASRMRAALEGALEDRLLDEPGNLAFAIGPQPGPAGTALVAVFDKQWLHAALEFFELAKRPVARAVPEFSPPQADQPPYRLFVTGTVHEPWLTLVDAHGVLCVPLGASAVVLGAAAREFDSAPVLAEPAVAALAEQALGRPVSIQPVGPRLLASGHSTWELAQFDLAISSGGRFARRSALAWQQFLHMAAWRPARWGLVVLLVANLLGLNAWAWRQDASVQAKRAQVKGLLNQTFPGIKTIVDAPVQMEREIALLRQASGALSVRDMEVMLGALGVALPPGQAPTSIDFSPGEAAARGLGLNPAQVALANSKLAASGYTARLDGERLVVRLGDKP